MTDIGAKFRALHRRGDPFVLMNAWDAGTARVMAALGAQAIGTSSAAHAFTLGLPDMGHVTRDQALAHAHGFGDYIGGIAIPILKIARYRQGYRRHQILRMGQRLIPGDMPHIR